jgi:hypothetical protein
MDQLLTPMNVYNPPIHQDSILIFEGQTLTFQLTQVLQKKQILSDLLSVSIPSNMICKAYGCV